MEGMTNYATPLYPPSPLPQGQINTVCWLTDMDIWNVWEFQRGIVRLGRGEVPGTYMVGFVTAWFRPIIGVGEGNRESFSLRYNLRSSLHGGLIAVFSPGPPATVGDKIPGNLLLETRCATKFGMKEQVGRRNGFGRAATTSLLKKGYLGMPASRVPGGIP